MQTRTSKPSSGQPMNLNSLPSSRIGPGLSLPHRTSSLLPNEPRQLRINLPSRRVAATLVMWVAIIGIVMLWVMLHKGCSGTSTIFTPPTSRATSEVKATPATTNVDESVVIKIRPAGKGSK